MPWLPEGIISWDACLVGWFVGAPVELSRARSLGATPRLPYDFAPKAPTADGSSDGRDPHHERRDSYSPGSGERQAPYQSSFHP
jgi:hypothetical protein